MKCLIATSTLGAVSEVWLWRQIIGLKRLKPIVLTWAYCNREDYPLNGIDLHLLQEEQQLDVARPGIAGWVHRVRRAPNGNFFGTAGSEKRAIYEILTRERPEAILCHFGMIALRVLPVALELGIPLVAHFHGIDISSVLLRNNRWYRWSLARHVHSFSSIIVVDDHQRKWFADHGVCEEKLHTIPCGVPTSMFAPSSVRSESPINYVTVSRLSPEKALHLTIVAFHKLLQRYPSATLTIIGDGPERNRLEQMVNQMHLEGVVVLTGSLPPMQVRERLSKAHVFLQHSTVREGSSVSIAEASSMALPVVATRCGGIVSQIVHGETGYLVDQYDVDNMAHYMLRLAQDGGMRERMGKSGRRRMVEHFDTARQIAKLEQVIVAAAERNPTRSTVE